MGAQFTFSNLRISPAAVNPGELITATVDMTNTGDAAGSTDVHLTGWWVLTRLAWPDWNGGLLPVPWVEPGQKVPVAFQFAPSIGSSPGTRDIIIEGLAGTVQVLGGATADFTFSNLRISPPAVYPGELITVTVRATNNSGIAGSTDVHLTGWWVLTKNTGVIPAGGSVDVVFAFYPSIGSSPGIRDIIVEGLSGVVEVRAVAQDTGTITIHTNVEADIYIDSILAGNTSLGSLVVTRYPGTYEVGFGPVGGYATPPSQAVTVVAGANVDVTATYIAGTEEGMLVIYTTPVGAQVFVNDIYVGETLADIPIEMVLPADTYVVSFGDVPGYATPDPQSVAVPADTEVTVTGIYQAGGTTDGSWMVPAGIAAGLGLVGLVLAKKAKR